MYFKLGSNTVPGPEDGIPHRRHRHIDVVDRVQIELGKLVCCNLVGEDDSVRTCPLDKP